MQRLEGEISEEIDLSGGITDLLSGGGRPDFGEGFDDANLIREQFTSLQMVADIGVQRRLNPWLGFQTAMEIRSLVREESSSAMFGLGISIGLDIVIPTRKP